MCVYSQAIEEHIIQIFYNSHFGETTENRERLKKASNKFAFSCGTQFNGLTIIIVYVSTIRIKHVSLSTMQSCATADLIL